MKQKLLFLSLFAVLLFYTAKAQCDPWIVKAYQELYSRTPSAEECNIRNYNNGSWNSYNELAGYIKNYNTNKTATASATNCDPWITKAYQEIYNRNPSAAECNIRNYNNGSWNSYNELVSHIRNYNSSQVSSAPQNNNNSNTTTTTSSTSQIKGDPWIYKAYRELYRRNPNAAELNKFKYNGGSWGSYEELKGYVRQYRTNLSKYGIDIKIKDLGTGYLLAGYTKNNQLTALNLISADGGAVVAAGGANVVAAGGANVVAPGGANVVAPGGANVVAPGGLNLRDIIANFIRDNGGMVIAPGGANILNMNAANLTQNQIMSGIQNIAGAGFGGSFRIASAGEEIIPTSGSGAIIFK